MELEIRFGTGRDIKWKYILVEDIPWKDQSSGFLIQNKIGGTFLIHYSIQMVRSQVNLKFTIAKYLPLFPFFYLLSMK